MRAAKSKVRGKQPTERQRNPHVETSGELQRFPEMLSFAMGRAFDRLCGGAAVRRTLDLPRVARESR
jgi:hypothetical protein